MAKVFILGSGGFGISLGVMAHQMGHQVTMWSYSQQEADMLRRERESKKLLPGIVLAPEIAIQTDFSRLDQSDLVIIATPSHAVRSVSHQIGELLSPQTIVACVSKGLEPETLKRMSQVMEEEIRHNPCVILSGPSHAEELAKKVPTAIVAASRSRQAAEAVQELLSNRTLRIYVNDDVTGVELGGALKNVIALAAGILDGLGLGDNSKAALMTRGITEIARLGIACGASSETFGGLSGMGDLIVTCTSLHSRNRRAGILIGSGVSPAQAVEQIGMTVEGYKSTKAAYEMSQRLGVEMPITTEVYRVLYEDKDPKAAIADLMGRPSRHESESIWLSGR